MNVVRKGATLKKNNRNMKLKIAVLPGDGIGPEIMEQGVAVMNAVAAKFFLHQVHLEPGDLPPVLDVEKMGNRTCRVACSGRLACTIGHNKISTP